MSLNFALGAKTQIAPPCGTFGGVERVWELATGKKQPEAVRVFAATYLKAHHPDLGPRLPEAKASAEMVSRFEREAVAGAHDVGGVLGARVVGGHVADEERAKKSAGAAGPTTRLEERSTHSPS